MRLFEVEYYEKRITFVHQIYTYHLTRVATLSEPWPKLDYIPPTRL